MVLDVHTEKASTLVLKQQGRNSTKMLGISAMMIDTDHALSEVSTPVDKLARTAVAKNVKRLRQRASMSQTDLGAKSGLAQTVISYVENPDSKSPTVETLEAIAKAFKIPAWALLIDVGDLSPEVVTRADFVIHAFFGVNDEGRSYIERAANAEARYNSPSSARLVSRG